ncbi:unnamed protein product [Schistocephalus solidus]|uniref:Uncharacterized protein n=1 Tax=Schistocephalus solidus TaxID=70667 RepID=A0A183S9M1_SCHSO|nr:unnamed protein product [Schistocephalus solidus]
MKLFTILVLLFITGVFSTVHKKNVVTSVTTSLKKFILPGIPTACLKSLVGLIKWEIIVKSKQEIEWIYSWTNSSTCRKCVGTNIGLADIVVCMNCLRPHEQHICKLPGCMECFTGGIRANAACKRCLVETIYVTEAVTCMVDAKVRRTVTLLNFAV